MVENANRRRLREISVTLYCAIHGHWYMHSVFSFPYHELQRQRHVTPAFSCTRPTPHHARRLFGVSFSTTSAPRPEHRAMHAHTSNPLLYTFVTCAIIGLTTNAATPARPTSNMFQNRANWHLFIFHLQLNSGATSNFGPPARKSFGPPPLAPHPTSGYQNTDVR